ncbi:type VI secretion system-associated protein TagO [Gilvimarinus agarilyticus]|uniref:type VI secretion system-associated protein TagO n=1 Tax=Gilvimarinus agarilyticus TaxID=679259 RepID=UPI000696A6AC|nr:type VI secretion system-associated protein TagO [Gilvimarinus agarilyticus]
MKLKALCLLILTSAPQLLYAETTKEIAKCAATSADATRLICYDDLAKSLGVDKPKTTHNTGAGNWSVTTKVSPIDDTTNVYMSVQADESVQSGYKKVRPSLHIRCKEDSTDVYFSWGLYLGTKFTRILTRLDKEEAKDRLWNISTDRKAAFAIDNDILPYIKNLFGNDKLLAQVTPYGESPVMATFSITGTEEAIKPLREACHW